MADRFQNGLLLTSAAAGAAGRTFSRWLVEFATQICGWTLVDDDPGTGSYDAYQAEGYNGASVDGSEQRFDISGDPYTFTTADEGRYLTITGMPAGFEDRNGIYRIAKYVDADTVDLDIRFSVHDAGIPHPSTGLTWRLWGAEATDVPSSTNTEWAVIQGIGTQQAATYNFQVRVLQNTSNSHLPQFEVGPFAGWNAGTNAWDQPNTGNYEEWQASSMDNCRIYAAGDSDRIVVAMRTLDDNYYWNFLYIGEIDAFYDETIDPNPVLVWNGNSNTSDVDNMFGPGSTTTLHKQGRMLGADDSTTVDCFANHFCTGASGNEGWTHGATRRWSARTRRIYRQSWIVESRTLGLQEYRGALRRCWIAPESTLRAKPFGRNDEFLHIWGGVTIPWNGSGQHEQRTTRPG